VVQLPSVWSKDHGIQEGWISVPQPVVVMVDEFMQVCSVVDTLVFSSQIFAALGKLDYHILLLT